MRVAERGPGGIPFLVAALWSAALLGQGASETASFHTWAAGAGGAVRAVATDGLDAVIGGGFSELVSTVRTHGFFDVATGALRNETYGILDLGTTKVAVPDGAGGFYLGGRYVLEGSPGPHGVLHLLASGAFDPAFSVVMPDQPLFGGSWIATFVHDLHLEGGTLWVAGSFGVVNGLPRTHVVALDATTGQVRVGFDAGIPAPATGPALDAVEELAYRAPTLFLRGRFSQIQGQPRAGLAAVDAVSGALRPWDPMPALGSEVYGMTAAGGSVWLVGTFTSLQGQPVARVARVDAATGAPVPGFAATATAGLNVVHVDGARLYVAGFPGMINGAGPTTFAALDAATGATLPWTPPPFAVSGISNPIYTITTSPGRVWVGGAFTTAGGVPRQALAALDDATAALLPFDASLQQPSSASSAAVYDVDVQGARVHVLGSFTPPSRARSNAAGIDLRSGFPRPFAPVVNGSVEALAVDSTTTWLAGLFSNVGGQLRIGIAAVDRATGAVTPWNALSNSAVTRLARSGGTLYCAGNFTSIGGQPRIRLAAVDATSALATPFDPAPDGAVDALEVAGGTLYVGGAFTTIAGQPRGRVAAFDLSTGQLLPWNPGADARVTALRADGTTVLLGGEFSAVGGQPRDGLAAVDAATGQVQAWNPGVGATAGPRIVASLEVLGPRVWVGGLFDVIGGQARANLAELDRSTGLATTWGPEPLGPVSVVRRIGRRLVVAGAFTQVGGAPFTRGVGVFALRDLATVGVAAPACSLATPAPRLTSTRPLMPGGHLYVIDRAPPFASGALYVSFEPAPNDPPLLLPGGCRSGIDLGSLALLTPVAADAGGTWQYFSPLPSIPALLNLPLRVGAVLAVPQGAVSGAFDLTETLELTLGS